MIINNYSGICIGSKRYVCVCVYIVKDFLKFGKRQKLKRLKKHTHLNILQDIINCIKVCIFTIF